MVNPLRLLKHKLPSKHLEKIYSTFIIPVLDHGDILYQSCCVNSLSQLESIHYRAACCVSGAIRGSNTSKVLKNLNWETLATRRQYHLNCYSYKVEKGLKPSYIQDILVDLQNADNRQERNTRNRQKYMLPARISSRYKTSSSLSLVNNNNINTINTEIFKYDTFASFKRNQRSKLYPIHNRTPTTHLNLPIDEAKFLNRMRVGLCLKSHQYAHNFASADDPKCQCGYRSQSENHFFLDCPMTANTRAYLLRAYGALGIDAHYASLTKTNKIKFLLYGNSTLTVNTNDKILKATSEFITSHKNLLNLR